MAKPEANPALTPSEMSPTEEPKVYDPLSEAKRLLRTVRAGALATLEPADGSPFATLVTVATDHDGSPILLTSSLSAHSRNMKTDPRVSLLLAPAGKGDPLAHPRLTLSGLAQAATAETRTRLRARFLARHPKAALYANFADFSFWRISPIKAHFNGGFAKAAQFSGADLLTVVTDAEAVIAAEPEALAHLNADHVEALNLFARAIARERATNWRAFALDPEGLDLRAGAREIRIVFARRVTSPHELRQTLVDLGKDARTRLG